MSIVRPSMTDRRCFLAAGVASPETPFRAVERLEDLGRPQAALAVLQARQGSSSGALPASQGLGAARIGMRLLLRCGLLPEAYAEVGEQLTGSCILVWFGHLDGTFGLQRSVCLSLWPHASQVEWLKKRPGYTFAETFTLGLSGAAARHAECSVGWPVQGKPLCFDFDGHLWRYSAEDHVDNTWLHLCICRHTSITARCRC